MKKEYLLFLAVIFFAGCSNKINIEAELLANNVQVLQEHITGLESEQELQNAKQDALEERVKNLETVVFSGKTSAEIAVNDILYTVMSWSEYRDCLWNISLRKYGTGFKWTEIYQMNKDQIKNPDLIYPGQDLNLP